MDRRRFLRRGVKLAAGTALGVLGVNAISPWLLPERPEVDTNRSFWNTLALPHNPPLRRDLDVDVAVIGGGYTGLSSAYHIALAQPRKKVVVLEARGVGNGASGRNGAMLLPNTADAYMHWPFHPDRHRHIYDLTVDSMHRLIALAQSSAVENAVTPGGALKTCATRKETDHARTYVDKARPLGIPVEFWGKEKIDAALGTQVFQGAVFDPNAGYVHPMKLVQVLKLQAEAAGVGVYEDSPVQVIEEGPILHVHLSGGQTVKTTSIVLATNAYSPRLGYFRNAIVPVYNYVAATPPLGDSQLAALGWRSRLPFHDSKRLVHYLGVTHDNRVHVGGGTAAYEFNNGVDERPDPTAIAQLQEEFRHLYPAAMEIGFEVTWDGLVDMTLDWAPIVGVTGRDGNIFYGMGYCGHGINLSFLFGRIIADLQRGKAEVWADLPFLNRRAPYVPNEPFRWLGVEGEIAYSRMAQ